MTHTLRIATLALLATLGLSACFDRESDVSTGSSAMPSSAPSAQVGTAGAPAAPVASGANSPPQISGTPASEIPAGFPYVFKPVAADADRDTLRFEILGRPSWANFDSATGELRGVPTANDVGVSTGITIIVSDGRVSASLGPFQVRVNRSGTGSVVGVGARPPTIGGTPPTSVQAGTGYSFQIVASDPDGDRLTYGALNLPAWLGINTANGTLTGTPSATQAGVYSNIVISVTDGASTVSLPAFAVLVSPAPNATGGSSVATGSNSGEAAAPLTTNGTATLRWLPPTQATDGSAITDLAGYRVKSGRTATDLTVAVNLASPSASSHTLQNLTSGTWFFAVVAYTAAGLESDVSAVVSKTFP